MGDHRYQDAVAAIGKQAPSLGTSQDLGHGAPRRAPCLAVDGAVDHGRRRTTAAR